jgi:hypothetical protein
MSASRQLSPSVAELSTPPAQVPCPEAGPPTKSSPSPLALAGAHRCCGRCEAGNVAACDSLPATPGDITTTTTATTTTRTTSLLAEPCSMPASSGNIADRFEGTEKSFF